MNFLTAVRLSVSRTVVTV